MGSTTGVVLIKRRSLQDFYFSTTTTTRTVLANLIVALDTPGVELEVRELRSQLDERSLR